MKLGEADVLMLLGIRRSGKSTWLDKVLIPEQRRVLCWDPHGEHATRDARTLDDILADPSLLDRETYSVSVVPSWREPDELAEQFPAFATLAASAEGACIIVEECGLLGAAKGSLEYLATQSGHWQAPLVLVAQRATQITKTAREQCSRVVSFRQNSPDDVDALVDRCGPRAQQVRRLPQYECWVWDETQAFDDPQDTTTAQESTEP